MGQKNNQNQVWEQSSEVHNLQKDGKREQWSTFRDTLRPMCRIYLGVGEVKFECYALTGIK